MGRAAAAGTARRDRSGPAGARASCRARAHWRRARASAALVIEIGVVQERAAVDEIAAHVADRPLDLALGLRAIRATGARREAPVMREAQKLGIADERAALEPQVARDHRLHLIEEQLLRHAAERQERLLESAHQRRHVLARIEAAPQQPRVAEHHEQARSARPRRSEIGRSRPAPGGRPASRSG